MCVCACRHVAYCLPPQWNDPAGGPDTRPSSEQHHLVLTYPQMHQPHGVCAVNVRFGCGLISVKNCPTFFPRARGDAEVCVSRLSGDGVRVRQRAGEVQCDCGVCLQAPAALYTPARSEPRGHRRRPLWNNSHRWEAATHCPDRQISVYSRCSQCTSSSYPLLCLHSQFQPTCPPTWRCWRKITVSTSKWVFACFQHTPTLLHEVKTLYAFCCYATSYRFLFCTSLFSAWRPRSGEEVSHGAAQREAGDQQSHHCRRGERGNTGSTENLTIDITVLWAPGLGNILYVKWMQILWLLSSVIWDYKAAKLGSKECSKLRP